MDDVGVTLLGIIYIPFLLSFVFWIRYLNNGFALTWLAFVGTFTTDIFAYFIGKFFGKRKLFKMPEQNNSWGIGGVVEVLHVQRHSECCM